MTKKHLFSRLLKKAILMALWTKASLCGKSSLLEQSLPRTPSRLRIICVNPVILSNLSSCLRALRGENLLCSYNVIARKYLRIDKALYNCRDTSTTVMDSLQIRLFMQNKAKFRKSQMNVNKVLTKDYEKKTLGERGKKQSQTKPNKAKFKKAKMNVTSILTVAYENKPPIMAPKKQSQTSKRQKTMQPVLPQRIMKITAISASDKTNPNEPNQTQFQFSTMLNCAICRAACHLEHERDDDNHNENILSIYH